MRKADSGREVAVTVPYLPKHVVCGVPFVATVRVTNNSARHLQLQLQFRQDEMRGIVCHSLSHQVRRRRRVDVVRSVCVRPIASC